MPRFLFAVVAALMCSACYPPTPPEPPPETIPSQPRTAPEDALAHIRILIIESQAQYTFSLVDLNADGAYEVVMYVMSKDFCHASGCPLFVMKPRENGGYSIIGQTRATARAPVRLLPTSTNGWRDLSVAVGDGDAPDRHVKMSFDGQAYPHDPATVQATVDPAMGQQLIAAGDKRQPLPFYED